MTFVNLSMTLGGLLIGIPIVLHLFMRQKPKQFIFPAIRFVQQRQKTNERRLQLRHWLLLLLRCLVVAFAAAALSRPHVDSTTLGNWLVICVLGLLFVLVALIWVGSILQKRDRTMVVSTGLVGLLLLGGMIALVLMTLRHGGEVAITSRADPIAAVLVFDTSSRMDYIHENKTRLEESKTTGSWLLNQFPADSDIAIIESRAGLFEERGNAEQSTRATAGFVRDRGAAEETIRRLQTTAVGRPMRELLQKAAAQAAASRCERKEIFVFTDLTQAAWKTDLAELSTATLESLEDCELYIIDVGVEDPQNLSIRNLHLSAEVLSRNDLFTIEAEISRLGSYENCLVDLQLEEANLDLPVLQDGKLLVPTVQRRGREVCDFKGSGSQQVRFVVRGIPHGVHHGSVKIIGEDGLSVDDVRHFSIKVQDAWPVLVVAPNRVNTFLLTEALASFEERSAEQGSFLCEEPISQVELVNHSLENYSIVCLLDPRPLTPDDWTQLLEYVEGGGSLAVFLGHNANPTGSFNDPIAQQLLPGKLARQTRNIDRSLFLAPGRLDHPALQSFRSLPSASVPWSRFPILRHWDIDPVGEESQVILRYGNDKPAILSRHVGRGQVVLMTTPITEVHLPPGWRPWNELAGENDWPRFVLVNDLFRFLAEQSGQSRLNYLAGERVWLPNSSLEQPVRYQLFAPQSQPYEVTAFSNRLSIQSTAVIGAYRLKGDRDGPVVRGFCMNLPKDAGDLLRTDQKNLDDWFGMEGYQYVRSREEIEFGVRESRQGQELYPFLIVLLALLLGLEQTLSNRFYKTPAIQ